MANISGRITVHGEPAPRATVELHSGSGDHISQVVVDDSGGYRFHLAPGTWRLKVYDPHGHRGETEFRLGDDDETVDLELEEPEGGH